MVKKIKANSAGFIMASELSLEEWLSLLGTNKWKKVLPNNCFPTDKHREEYLSQVNNPTEKEFKNLARCFLNQSGYYGQDPVTRIIENYGAEAILKGDFRTEFDRRSLSKDSFPWEGITWILDLLPNQPLDAIAATRAYLRAHYGYFTDNMIWGHHDVVDIIQSRYKVMAKYSCFISYGAPDEDFARKLYTSLTQAGVEAFFFPINATPGRRLHKEMREGVNQYDRIILICSKGSLNRPGFLNELTETLQREARDGGKEYMIPIRLDNYVFTNWAPEDAQLAQAVRDRVVADFSEALEDDEKYNEALEKLITALSQPMI